MISWMGMVSTRILTKRLYADSSHFETLLSREREKESEREEPRDEESFLAPSHFYVTFFVKLSLLRFCEQRYLVIFIQ